MDVLDAGVYVSKWEASVPRHTKMTLWGPLQAREMGLEGWDVQDGGETGFVLHNPGAALTMGRATSTLIFVRRLERAFLTIYFGGYPADAPVGQRRLDMQKAVAACEVFLTRLARQPVQFHLAGELALVDNVNDHAIPVESRLAATPSLHPPGAPGGPRGSASAPVQDPAAFAQRPGLLGSGAAVRMEGPSTPSRPRLGDPAPPPTWDADRDAAASLRVDEVAASARPRKATPAPANRAGANGQARTFGGRNRLPDRGSASDIWEL